MYSKQVHNDFREVAIKHIKAGFVSIAGICAKEGFISLRNMLPDTLLLGVPANMVAEAEEIQSVMGVIVEQLYAKDECIRIVPHSAKAEILYHVGGFTLHIPNKAGNKLTTQSTYSEMTVDYGPN